MSFFFGKDLWDEMDRMQRQLEDLSYQLDFKRPRIDDGSKNKKGKQCKSLCPFSQDDMSVFNPVTDLAENDKSYVVSMDLPGVKKDELNITVHNGVLTVSGTRHHKFETHDDDDDEKEKEKVSDDGKEKEKKEESEGAAQPSAKSTVSDDEEKKKKESEKKPKHKVIRMESFYGSFERSISVPVHTTPDDVHAKFEDGVLTITIDKPKKEEMKKIEIQ